MGWIVFEKRWALVQTWNLFKSETFSVNNAVFVLYFVVQLPRFVIMVCQSDKLREKTP